MQTENSCSSVKLDQEQHQQTSRQTKKRKAQVGLWLQIWRKRFPFQAAAGGPHRMREDGKEMKGMLLQLGHFAGHSGSKLLKICLWLSFFFFFFFKYLGDRLTLKGPSENTFIWVSNIQSTTLVHFWEIITYLRGEVGTEYFRKHLIWNLLELPSNTDLHNLSEHCFSSDNEVHCQVKKNTLGGVLEV